MLAEVLPRVPRPAMQLLPGTRPSCCAAARDAWYDLSGGNLAVFIETTDAIPYSWPPHLDFNPRTRFVCGRGDMSKVVGPASSATVQDGKQPNVR